MKTLRNIATKRKRQREERTSRTRNQKNNEDRKKKKEKLETSKHWNDSRVKISESMNKQGDR